MKTILSCTFTKGMTRALQLTAALLFLMPAALFGNAAVPPSPTAVVAGKSGTILFVAEKTAGTIAQVDLSSGAVLNRIPLPQPPSALALSPDEKILYAAGADPEGALFIIHEPFTEVTETFRIGHTPESICISPDGTRAYVACRFNDDIAVVDTAEKTVLSRINAVREPVAAALTPDGSLLFVANLIPKGSSDGDYAAARISIIDTMLQETAAEVFLLNGSSSLRGICVSPDGNYVYVSHILARYHLPTTQLERGWMNTNALSILSVAEKKLINTVLLDDVDAGASNPWGLSCTPDGKCLVVTHAGTHEISVIDRDKLHAKLGSLSDKEGSDTPNNLSFLVDLRTRIKLPGNGPRALWLSDDTAVIANYFSGSIACVPLHKSGTPEIREILLTDGAQTLTEERKGEINFHDAALCFQQWQSCVSCHPDARVDGLNWDLLNDGIGNPKNTRSMLLSHQTPPVMSLGVRAKAEVAVRAGIKFIQFAVRPEEDAEAIDAYLKALTPVPSPRLEKGALSPSAQRGEILFKQAHCAECHPAPLYTDLKLHTLGTTRGMDEGKSVDTPTLIEVWRTAPYLHDGRAATLHELFTIHNSGDRHGKTSSLNEEELADLISYVESL
ncbi:MAG TPA: beta-propeller fold lactonase family protein [Candidatus Hydrogenedentes bacterium]|jgi:YVTN family beta-propeller protein|nr:MAG: Lactonase, 7-bladed beta-propeller [Candidatus Hydrogenedentes bacterium ADurb.Bin170]HOD95474.1 beta-propeller fold lactonase family protein [Candidatus Hydrogenedentota bacterium]HOR50707.1 beta-propeller fold lactonase family protein [Candidatus Hydrogenedentota bacterium]HPK24106.1 beta-propeller fold lactonase family protein [Candidatus Hydrogenedentota bacterium]HPX86234.1 beta-propeller fold lactonase family protein [Candidatus Hydrogenedentota bacterium]